MEHVLECDEPLSVREVAEHFGLHANAARMHLEKLVKGGLLRVVRRRDNRGGRPAHLYRASDEDWEFYFPPRRYKLLAEVLVNGISALNELPSPIGDEAFKCGREEATRTSSPLAYLPPGAGAPEVIRVWADEAKSKGLKIKLYENGDEGKGLVYLSCPFGEFSRRYPSLVCEIHRCVEEGLLSLAGEWRVKAKQAQTGCFFSLHEV